MVTEVPEGLFPEVILVPVDVAVYLLGLVVIQTFVDDLEAFCHCFSGIPSMVLT